MTPVGLKNMLRKHPYLYLKPISGKAGVGIMTILIQPDKPKPYRLKVQSKKKSITYRCASISNLWSRIKKQSSGEAILPSRA